VSESPTDRPTTELRHRQTAASVGSGSPEPSVQAVGSISLQAAGAAPPSHDVVRPAAAAAAGSGGGGARQEQEDDDGSRRLLSAVMSTLRWNNDTRRDPLIVVGVVALLFM